MPKLLPIQQVTQKILTTIFHINLLNCAQLQAMSKLLQSSLVLSHWIFLECPLCLIPQILINIHHTLLDPISIRFTLSMSNLHYSILLSHVMRCNALFLQSYHKLTSQYTNYTVETFTSMNYSRLISCHTGLFTPLISPMQDVHYKVVICHSKKSQIWIKYHKILTSFIRKKNGTPNVENISYKK